MIFAVLVPAYAMLLVVTDSNGRATELILHQSGRDQHAKRIE